MLFQGRYYSVPIMSRLVTYSLVSLIFLLKLINGEIQNEGWWKNTVFYQIYPRSFMDADGDGVGDLNGITSKLQHFKDTGIGGVWLSPIYTSPMIDFGYDIQNFTEVDPIFGNIVDFENLVREAKRLGVKVILDFVPNHTSDKHAWFEKSIKRESPYEDFFLWKNGTVDDDGTRLPPNNWISVFSGSAWTFNEERGEWFFHQFTKEQPDLNYFNTLVQEEMKEVLKFWLEKGVDGFRIDAVPHLVEVEELTDEPRSNVAGVNPDEYGYLEHIYTKDHPLTYQIMTDWREVLDNYTESTNTDEKVLMTEAYTNLTNTLKYYDHGAQIPFNFKFIMEITNTSTATNFKTKIDEWLDNMPSNRVANWVVGNHDRSRTASRFHDRADQMTMLTMILPGVAVTYYGEEIGMIDTWVSWENTQDPQACNTDESRYESHSRDPNRSPFQWDATTSSGFSTNSTTWLPVNDNYRTLNLAKQKSDSISHYKIYQKLVALRNSVVLREGYHNVTVLNNVILAVTRTLVQDGNSTQVVLLINFSDDIEHTVNLVNTNLTDESAEAYVYTSSIDYVTNMGDSVNVTGVSIPAKASLVLISTSQVEGGNGSGDGNNISASFSLIMILNSIIRYYFSTRNV